MNKKLSILLLLFLWTSSVNANFAMEVSNMYNEPPLVQKLEKDDIFWDRFDYYSWVKDELKKYDDLPEDDKAFWELYDEKKGNVTSTSEFPISTEVVKPKKVTMITCEYSNTKESFSFNIRDEQWFIAAAYDKSDDYYIRQDNGRYVYVPEDDDYLRVSTCDFSPLRK